MRITKLLRPLAARFAREDRGSVAVEAVLILPILIWTFLLLFSTFHTFRTYDMAQKAAYTIGDLVSRETTPINRAYIKGTEDLLEHLTRARNGDTAIRITSVKWDNNRKVYKRDWSKSTNWVAPVRNNEVKKWNEMLPVLPHNERVVVVETFVRYKPPFDVGLVDREVRNFIFTKPRYAPQVLWSSG